MKRYHFIFIYIILLFGTGISAAASLEGIVTDAKTGLPILGVNVTISTNPESSIPVGYNYYAVTDSTGNYYIPDIKPGVYTLLADHKDYQSYMPEKLLMSDSSDVTIEFNFQLVPNQVVDPPVKTGKISGKVFYDSTGLPIMGAYIRAVLPENIMENVWDENFTVSDSGGFYVLPLPAGRYKVLCYYDKYDKYSYGGYYQEYYNNVINFEEAAVIEVKEDSHINGIDFGIPLFAEDTVIINISGQVRDNTGSPLANVYVDITFPDICTIALYPPPGYQFGTYTDDNGYYTIKFPLRNAYYAKSCVLSAYKENYVYEFYKEKKEFYEADRLYFDSSYVFENIDFTLDAVVPQQSYSINGVITNDEGETVQSALVIGINKSTNNYHYTLSDSSGFYSINNVESGKYYILFIAKWYAPEFYDNALLWEDAAIIDVDKDIYGIDASLSKMDAVLPDSSLVIISGFIKSYDNIALPGVLITVLNEKNKIAAYDVTDAAGAFKIEGLSKGNYTVQASLVNYNSKDKEISIDASGGMQIVNFNMSLANVTSVKEKTKLIPDKLELYPNHPNPFNPSTVISFALPQTENVILKVYNIIGQEVATLMNSRLNAGTYNVQFDAGGLGSGVYLYQLKTGSGSIVKKMLLTK